MRFQAVVFDLHQTLIRYDVPGGEAHWGGRTIDSLEQVLELA